MNMKSAIVVASLLFTLFSIIPVAASELSPTEVKGAMTIDEKAAKVLFDKGAIFVDVRKDSDWNAGRIPGAVHIELKKVLSEHKLLEAVAKNKEVIFYCNGPKCMRSSKATAKAVSWGFNKVYYYRDGFPSWQSAGYPVE